MTQPASDVLVVLGVALIAVAALGLIRLPDAFNRINAVAKAASLGVVLILLGVALRAPTTGAVVTLILAAVLQLATAPIAGYAAGRAARRSGAPLVAGTRQEGTPGPKDAS
ncbi:hypothetical protein GCM10009716_10040 [Streptomyces sodiiphilus]|uniref:Monovalent cation/H(+) antiporter subunit G n=1 Tax=Streptomyces sodiiphilus TaxID=226217 RepID=A0ABP5A6L1_9ACTN